MVYNRDISKTKPFAELNAKVANTQSPHDLDSLDVAV